MLNKNYILIAFILILSSLTTFQSMKASQQINEPNQEQLDKISLIYEILDTPEIELASFLNEDVMLSDCKVIFNQNDFKDYQYEICDTLTNDLYISALDKKEAVESIIR